MVLFEWTLVLLLGAVLVAALARRLESLIRAAGMAGVGAGVPAGSRRRLRSEPDLALALSSRRSARCGVRHLAAGAQAVCTVGRVAGIVAVVLTTAAVALVGWKLAGLPVAAAIALGAIVAPPDAVAAQPCSASSPATAHRSDPAEREPAQ